jgi:hypothetical protein
MDTNREAKTDQTRPRPGSDRRMETPGVLGTGQRLPEAFWPRLMVLWRYSGTPPFFAAFRSRPVR